MDMKMRKVIYNYQICSLETNLPEEHHLWEEDDTDKGEQRAYIKVWKNHMGKKVKLYCIEKTLKET
jgi:hypothetical protein